MTLMSVLLEIFHNSLSRRMMSVTGFTDNNNTFNFKTPCLFNNIITNKNKFFNLIDFMNLIDYNVISY